MRRLDLDEMFSFAYCAEQECEIENFDKIFLGGLKNRTQNSSVIDTSNVHIFDCVTNESSLYERLEIPKFIIIFIDQPVH